MAGRFGHRALRAPGLLGHLARPLRSGRSLVRGRVDRSVDGVAGASDAGHRLVGDPVDVLMRLLRGIFDLRVVPRGSQLAFIHHYLLVGR